MEKLDRKKIKIKNLIGIIDTPSFEDLLFEIVDFLERERRFDGEFKKGEVVLKTRCRIKKEVVEDLEVLCESGYIEKGKWSAYKVLKHPWEITKK